MAYIVWKMLQPRIYRFRRIAYIHWWYVLVILLLIQTLSIVDGHPKSANDGITDRHGHQRFAMEPQDQTGLIKTHIKISRYKETKRKKITLKYTFITFTFLLFLCSVVLQRLLVRESRCHVELLANKEHCNGRKTILALDGTAI